MRKLLKRDEGFTLIELMVVVLIIGILVAIALPTFLGARNRANDKAAQSGVRNALAAAKTCFTDDDSYELCDDGALTAIETSLIFNDATTSSDDPGIVSVLTDNGGSGSNWVMTLSAWSKSGNCFAAQDDPQNAPGTAYATYADADGTTCDATTASGSAFTPDGW